MSGNKLKKINIINSLQEKTSHLKTLTSQESEKIRGGSLFPWLPAEEGYPLIWGKCGADEVIGPDGECHKTSKFN